jgi:hypothetical protein
MAIDNFSGATRDRQEPNVLDDALTGFRDLGYNAEATQRRPECSRT